MPRLDPHRPVSHSPADVSRGDAARTHATGAHRSQRTHASTKAKFLAERDALPTILSLIESAETSIDVVAYNFYSENGDAKAIAEALIAKKNAKPDVAIRVFVEGDHGDGAARNLKTVALLKAAGIDVVVDSKNLITHAKGIGVDGKQVLAGSTNYTNTSLDKNNEINALVSSPKLAKAWHDYVSALVADSTTLHGSKTKAGDVTMLTDDAYYDELMRMVTTSVKGDTLDAVMYCISNDPHDKKTQALLQALEDASARGVQIALYLEQDDSGFAPKISDDNKKVAARLRASANITVTFDPGDKITHAKGIVKNGKEALLGSTNWTSSDFDGRHQINWLITDPAFASTLSTWIHNKIANEAGQQPAAAIAPTLANSHANATTHNAAGSSHVAVRVPKP